jgi:hypothetical protein
MTIKKIIDLATAKIYEQSTGISQQEIERVIIKAILLVLEEGRKLSDKINWGTDIIEAIKEMQDV